MIFEPNLKFSVSISTDLTVIDIDHFFLAFLTAVLGLAKVLRLNLVCFASVEANSVARDLEHALVHF